MCLFRAPFACNKKCGCVRAVPRKSSVAMGVVSWSCRRVYRSSFKPPVTWCWAFFLKFLSHVSLQIINARSKNTEESWGCDRLTCVRQSFTVRATKKFVHVPRSSSSNLNQTEETCVLAIVQHSLVVTILAVAYISVPCIHNYGIVLS